MSRIIHYLASDSLKGRGNGSPELLKAGIFIGDEFKKNNLKPFPGFPSYFISFNPFGGPKKTIRDSLIWNGGLISPEDFVYVHPRPGGYKAKKLADFTIIKWDSCFPADILKRFSDDTTSLLIWTDKKQADGNSFLPEEVKTPVGGLTRDILLVYADSGPVSLLLLGNRSFYSMVEYNVVGILPGKTKPNEVIIFSAHYDHMGEYSFGKDRILNGANDDASGTTAVLALANYFSKRNDNERTIMFCVFAGEEMGLLGSGDFVPYIDPAKVIAGINIEMIGIPEFGKGKVFITGERYSSLPEILSKGLKRSGISVRPDPDEKKNLFLRSDNYPFNLQGVPFHTIMASDDDDECYHQPCDEVNRIDIANMTRIIKAIAASSVLLINGQATPTRIDPGGIQRND